jgi:hypothetical protein
VQQALDVGWLHVNFGSLVDIAVLSAAIALACADYFLQDPLYSLVNDNPREYGDLFLPF